MRRHHREQKKWIRVGIRLMNKMNITESEKK